MPTVLVSCPHPSCFIFTRSCVSLSIGVFWLGVLVFVWAPFCAFLRDLGTSTPWQSPDPALIPTLLGCDVAVQAARIPPPSPHTPPWCHIDPIPVSLGGPQH